MYRHNVCAVIKKQKDNKVLVCHRKGFPAKEGWQFPQGGVCLKKDLIEELKRELREEIGTDKVSVISILPKTYSYTFPEHIQKKFPHYNSQKQRWVLVQLETDDRTLSFSGENAEFDAYQWVTPTESLALIIDFKKKTYFHALSDLGLL